MSTGCRRRFLLTVISGATAGVASGCGTLLHPERRGQGRGSGKIDWRIAGLDAAGLLLFFVPGVVAFAVDFYEGTLFLPIRTAGITRDRESLVAVHVPPAELNRTRVEATVSSHIDRSVVLMPGAYRTSALTGLNGFWSERDKLMQG